jgi:hypothetical protein
MPPVRSCHNATKPINRDDRDINSVGRPTPQGQCIGLSPLEPGAPDSHDTIEWWFFPERAPKHGAEAVAETGLRMTTWTRVFIIPPLWIFSMVLIYTMRRVSCADCGIVVERVPWATGKHSLCDGFRVFLAPWARKLSWQEVALSFGVSRTISAKLWIISCERV